MNEWITLPEVYAAYLDCRKRKRHTKSCALFEMNEATNLYQLYEDLNNGTYEIGYSNAFCVTRPKIREVFAADFRDRIVHHLLMLKTLPLIEDYFIRDTFNCRKGKGTYAAHLRALQLSKEYSDGWVLSCDIQGFFMSIPKYVLADRLDTFLIERYKGEDLEYIRKLTRQVVMHAPETKCIKKGDLNLWEYLPNDKSLFTCGDGLGMAIGNLTSQVYANFFLTEFDHWLIKQGFGYCRYVDDFRVFAHTKEELLNLIPRIRDFLTINDHLKLHPKKIELQPVHRGFSFVGVNIKRDRVYTGNRTVNNCMAMIHSYNKFSEDAIKKEIDRYVQRYNSYMGYMIHYKSYAIRYNIWKIINEKFKTYIYLTDRMSVLKIINEYNPRIIKKQQYYDMCKHAKRIIQKV